MPVAEQPPFVGRRRELEVLTRHLGARGILIVEGEAGIGTSRLLAEALTGPTRDVRVLRGAGSETTRRPPFGTLARLIGMPPADGHLIGPLLDDVLRAGPLAVVLEDVHWIDPGWLDAIPRLLRHIERRAVPLVLTARHGPREAAVDRLFAACHDHGATRIQLPGLSPAETAELAAAAPCRAGAAPDHDLVERTGGNPRLILDLAAAGYPAGDALPVPLAAALVHRLAHLPARTGEVMRVAAVLGRVFGVAELARLTGDPPARLLIALDGALRAGLLVEHGGRLAFRHGLVREALSADVAPALRTALRVEAARMLAESDGAAGDGARLAMLADLRERGRAPDAVAEATAMLADRTAGPVTRARLHAEQARSLLACGDAGAAAAVAVAAAGPPDDPQAVCVARAVLAMVASGQGRTGLAVDLADDAMRRGRRLDAAPARGFARYARAVALLRADRVADAEGALADGALADGPAGLEHAGLRALIGFRLGRWEQAGTDPDDGPAGAATRAMIAVHRNDLDRADTLLAAEHTHPDLHAHWLAWARGLCAEARDAPLVAARELRRAWASCTRGGAVVDYALLGPDLVRLLLAVHDRDGATHACAQVTEIAARTGSAAAAGAALRCTALLTDDARAAARAAELLAGLPFPLLAAQAYEEAAVAPGAGDAVALLVAAGERYQWLGARRDQARVEARLRELGVHRRPHRRRAAAGHGWDSLTASEREIVALTAQGLTNREIGSRLFVSPRTVETHLTHVFAKLGVRGRSALRSAVSARSYGDLPDVRRARPGQHRSATDPTHTALMHTALIHPAAAEGTGR